MATIQETKISAVVNCIRDYEGADNVGTRPERLAACWLALNKNLNSHQIEQGIIAAVRARIISAEEVERYFTA